MAQDLETIVVDKQVLKALGGPEGLYAILEAMAKSMALGK
jgi:hypothetical protein